MLASSGDPAHRLDECFPGLHLRFEHASTVGRDFVEAPPPLAGFLDPGALDPTALLEPIQQRYREITSDPAYLDGILREGAERVIPIANSTVELVKSRMGLYTRS
jgi:hypothetical protein